MCPQGLGAGCSLCLQCSSLHTCSPTPIRSLLRCHLTWEASLTTPQGQTQPGPLSGQRTPGLLPLPCWNVIWALKREGLEHPASVGGRGDPVMSRCRRGTEWRLLPTEHSQEGRWGALALGSALVSATRILPPASCLRGAPSGSSNPWAVPTPEGTSPSWAPVPAFITYCTGQRKPGGPRTGSSESSVSAGLARRMP